MAAHPPSDAGPDATPPEPPRYPLWRRALRWIVWPLVALLLLVTGVAWLAGQEFTLRFAAREVAKATGGAITFEGVNGSLFGGLEVHRLRYEDASLAVETRDLRFTWYWVPFTRFYVRELSATALEIEQKLKSDEPPKLPSQLAIPVDVTIANLSLGSIEYRSSTGGRTVLGPVQGSADLGPDLHRLHVSEFAFYGIRIAADAEIDPTSPPYATQLQARWLSPGLGPIGAIQLDARGSLARLDVQAEASWRQPGGAPIVASTELKLFAESLQEMFTPIIVLADRVPVEVAAGVDVGLKAPLALEGTFGFDAKDSFGGKLKVENRAPGKLEAGRIPVTSITADFTTNDGARLENARIEVPGGGTLAARAHFDLKQEIEFTAHGFDPRGVSDYAVPMKLDGPVRLDIDEEGGVAVAIGLRGAGVEYAGKARIEPSRVEVESLRIGTGAGGLTLAGQVGFDGRRPLAVEGRMQGFDASRVLVALDPKDSLAGWLRSSLNGRLKVDGVLGMARKGKEPAVPLSLAIDSRIEPSTLSGLPLSGTVRGRLNGTGSFAGWSANDVDVALNFAENTVRLAGGLGIADRKLAVDINAPRLDRLSALVGEELSGRATARGTAGGSLAAPDATLAVTGDEMVLGRGAHALRLGMLRGRFAGNRERVDGELNIERLAALSQHFSGAQLTLAGRPSDHRLSVRARGEGAKPAVQFSADIAAGLRPAASAGEHPVWAGQLLRMSNLGQYAMQLSGPARFEVSAERQRFEGLDLVIDEARLQLARFEHTDAGFQTAGSLRHLSFASFERMYPQAKDWLPRATLAVDGRWDIGTLPSGQLNGTLRIERSDGDLWVTNSAKGALGISRLALDLVAKDNRIDSRLGFESARAGTLDAAFATTLSDRDGKLAITPDAPIDARLRGELRSFVWLTLSADSPVTADGLVTMDATAKGSFAQPRLDGELRGDGLVLRLLKPRARLDQGRVTVRFTENRAELREFSFKGRRGSLTGSGAIQFVNQRPNGSITLRADQLDASNDPNYQLAASGAVELALADGAARITGGLHADSASITLGDAFAPKLGNDVVIVSGDEPTDHQLASDAQSAESRREALPLTASLRFDLGNNFRVKGYGADAQLGGGIGIDVRPGQPLRANGVVEVLQGSYNAYSQKLVVDQGTISFVGPIDNPNLALRATRPELPVNVGVEIIGTARNPRLRLYSDTPMSDTERLSWLATGRGLDDSSRADLQYLSVAASALMSDNSGVPLTKRIAGAIGFDSISIGNRTPTSAVRGSSLSQQEVAFVTIGKRLSARLTFTFERALTGVGTFARLRYEIGRKFYVQTTTGDENAIDAFYTFTFD